MDRDWSLPTPEKERRPRSQWLVNMAHEVVYLEQGEKKNYEGKRRGENEILVQERKTQQLAVEGQSWVGGKEGTVQRGDAGPGFAYSEECIGGEWVESLASSDSLLR